MSNELVFKAVSQNGKHGVYIYMDSEEIRKEYESGRGVLIHNDKEEQKNTGLEYQLGSVIADDLFYPALYGKLMRFEKPDSLSKEQLFVIYRIKLPDPTDQSLSNSYVLPLILSGDLNKDNYKVTVIGGDSCAVLNLQNNRVFELVMLSDYALLIVETKDKLQACLYDKGQPVLVKPLDYFVANGILNGFEGFDSAEMSYKTLSLSKQEREESSKLIDAVSSIKNNLDFFKDKRVLSKSIAEMARQCRDNRSGSNASGTVKVSSGQSKEMETIKVCNSMKMTGVDKKCQELSDMLPESITRDEKTYNVPNMSGWANKPFQTQAEVIDEMIKYIRLAFEVPLVQKEKMDAALAIVKWLITFMVVRQYDVVHTFVTKHGLTIHYEKD